MATVNELFGCLGNEDADKSVHLSAITASCDVAMTTTRVVTADSVDNDNPYLSAATSGRCVQIVK